MNWSAYIYLVGIIIACMALFAIVVRLMPSLLHHSPTRTVSEILVLGGVVGLALLTIYFNFYRGYLAFSFLDVGNDTTEQYLPYYCNMVESIRSGSFGPWNHEYGLGTSFMSYQSWTLDPFNIVLVPLGLLLGTGRLTLALVIVQSLKVIAVAFLADHLLTFYCDAPLARVLGATLCAFSGYLMLWGQHYWLGTVFVMATLLPLLLELLMERWSSTRFLLLALGVALSIASSVYSGFMVMLFATVYALLRVAYVSDGGLVGFLRLFGRLTVPVICGILCSMVFVIPYASLMLGESTRVVGSDNASLSSRTIGFLGSFVPLRWLPAILSRAMGNGLVSYGDPFPDGLIPATETFPYVNVYEVIMLGLSAAVFLLLSQFVSWVAGETDRRTKVLVGVTAALVLLYCFNLFLPALSNALVAPKYRSSFAVVIPVCIAMAVGFDRKVVPARVSRSPLAAAAVLSIAVTVWSLIHTVDGRLACLWYLVSVCGITVLLWLLADHRGDANGHSLAKTGEKGLNRPPLSLLGKQLMFAVCCALIISTSVVDGFFSTNNRDICTPADAPGAQSSARDADTRAALAWLEEYDPSFWRVEKLYSDWTWLNDSLVEGYRGISSYNSTLDADVEEFYRQLWPEAIGGDIAYQVFRNDPNEPEILRRLGVKYLLSHDVLDWDWCREVAQFGDVHVYRNMRADSILTICVGTMTEGEAASFDAKGRRTMLGPLVIVPDEVGDSLLPDTPMEITDADLSSLDLSWMGLEEWQLGPDGLPAAVPASQALITASSPSSLSGTFFASVDAVGCLALPHVSGWTVTIDGSPVETTRANYGFIGFAVPAGVHQIGIEYQVPHIRLGLALSLSGILLAIACCVALRKNGVEE